MDPAGAGTGSTDERLVNGSYVYVADPQDLQGSFQSPDPSSSAHHARQARTDVQSTVASAQSPDTQGQLGVNLQWVSSPSNASGMPSLPRTPEVGQTGFNAKARGMGPAMTGNTPTSSEVSDPASASTPPSQANSKTSPDQPRHPFFIIEKFDGSTNLDTHLWTFHRLAEYLEWDERDEFFNLCTSLVGAARQVLRELPPKGTTEQLEEFLQTRFGTTKQAISYEAKLRARCRKKDEPLQDLHQDISRLVQLAHPTETAKFWSHVGINAFIDALDDKALAFEVMRFEPKTLPDAVNEAMRLESMAEAVCGKSPPAADNSNSRVITKDKRMLFAVTDNDKSKDETADLQQRLAQVEKQLKQATLGGAHSAPNSSARSNPRRGRGRRSTGQFPQLRLQVQGIKPTRRPTCASTVTNLATGNVIAPSVKTGQGKMQKSSPF